MYNTHESKYLVKNYRDINNNNVEYLSQRLADYDWGELKSCNDVHSAYNSFLSGFLSLYNECCPTVSKKIKVRNCHKPWITPGILTSVKKKNNLYKKWLKKRTDISLSKYKRYKNKLTDVMRRAEKLYYENRFVELKNDAKNTWKLIKSVINGNKTTSESISELSINGCTITDKTTMANKFNVYFTNIGSDLSKSIPKVSGSFSDYLNHLKPTDSFFITPTNPAEIIDIVQNLKSKKSSGYDDVHPSVVKAVIPLIAQPLAELFNESLSTGIFPDNLKSHQFSVKFAVVGSTIYV